MIKAIDTVYNGHKFRSRLEARWAIYFDHMDIKWMYEPEGYSLSNGQFYLPDFYFPDIKKYGEVKPFISTDTPNDERWRVFVEDLKTELIILKNVDVQIGLIKYWEEFSCVLCNETTLSIDFHWKLDREDLRCCVDCCKELKMESGIIETCYSFCGYDKMDYGVEIKAISAAKQARFEHGETPKF